MDEFLKQFPPTGWIWTPDWTKNHDHDPHIVLFRKILTLDALPCQFTVRLSADSRYKFYVNGAPVSVGPCKGDGKVWYFETVDLAPHLTAGENVLAAEVLRYPQGGMYNHSVWRTNTPGFYLKGTLDGETLLANKSWRCLIRPNLHFREEMPGFSPLYINEDTAGSADLRGWQRPGYDDGGWPPARAISSFEISEAVSPGALFPRPIPPMFERERQFRRVMTVREPAGDPAAAAAWTGLLAGGSVTVPAGSAQTVELDAGELTTGYLNLSFVGGKGASVRLICAESYLYTNPDLPAEYAMFGATKGDRCDFEQGVLAGYYDTYAVSGHGAGDDPEVYEPFWFRTFRFLRVEIVTGDAPLTLTGLRYRETGYPLEVKTQVAASDPDFAGIWDISLRSLRRCMHETYEDCPYYEQLQYAMDTRSQILYTYAVSADDRMARRTIDDFHRSLRPEGLTNCSYPCYGPNVIPGFSLYYILMIHDHMMYFGDREFLKKYLPTIDSILGFFDRNLAKNGMLRRIGEANGKYWSFIDWVPAWNRGMPNADGTGPVTMESFLYLYALQHAAELAEFCGREGIGTEYRTRAEALKAAIRRCCLGPNGLYQDSPGIEAYSQHCQAFAVLTGTAVPEETRPLMERALSDEVPARCTVAFAFYLFRALEQAGLYERTRELWEPWREMLRLNLTTCMESNDNPRSDCHAWGALLLYELPAVILGVRPGEPGFGTVKVSPVPGYLEEASGDVCTPRGMVHVAWKRRGEDIDLTVEAPRGVTVLK